MQVSPINSAVLQAQLLPGLRNQPLPRPSTKNTRSSKQGPGLAGSAAKPLFPCHDTGQWQSPPQHLLPASTGEKAEDHLPQQFRYLTWKWNRMAHKLLGRHPKQNKKPKTFCTAPPALLQTPQLGSGFLLCPGCVCNPWVKLLNH